MSGEEGKTNDAVRGSSQPAELCHLLSDCRCSAPQHHAPITSFSPCPNPHLLPATLQLQDMPDKESWEFALTHDRQMRKHSSSCTFPAKPLATCRIPVGGFPAKLWSLLNFSQTQLHPGQNAPHLESSLDQVPQRRCAAVGVLSSKWTCQHCRKLFHIYYKNMGEKKCPKRLLPEKIN